ncbi:hypothetical protein OC846_006335 [Tilletia horrida]|uniref:ATP11-domain-containing protein n=1 Tax=Tilletia horrida TaxID=155126 RepID=A0AAN6GJ22_9BASI|nr:hypothetical protein OC845_006354 [Tilletia horrida]KAK0543674.1 hypothetical protein OC846_006335 [Tilletia horrida]KAK0560029.1 hypothetical protein OC861_006440 [Tilletia horrida]
MMRHTCSRCLRTYTGPLRTQSASNRPLTTSPLRLEQNNTSAASAEEEARKQERINRLLAKARAVTQQHLQSQRQQSNGRVPTPSSAPSKLEQYAQALKKRAKEAGFDDVDSFRRSLKSAAIHKQAPQPAGDATQSQSAFQRKEEELRKKLQERAEQKRKAVEDNPASQTASNSPIKPLSSIMDLDKLLGIGSDSSSAGTPTTPAQVTELWTGYHTFKNKLSAVIPLDTYNRMLEHARKYPRFVVPLPRGDQSPGAEGGGQEIHYLEWALLPSAPSAAAGGPVPNPSTVLFTSLAEYKLRQEFAQPGLVLTHYTDLANSHGIVLMRGEISGRGAAKTGHLADAEAQRLCVNLQRFYLPNMDEAGGQERAELLRIFHEKPGSFDVQRLINAAAI